MTTTDKPTDLVTVITEDHRAAEGVFTELESGDGGGERRRNLVDHVIAELVRHSVAEEQFMYPAVRKYLDGGDEIADHEVKEHGEAEQLMKKLEGLDVGDAEFERTLGELIAAIRHHVEDEEGDLLPKLRSACSPEELDRLGDRVLQAKKIAPTRPHPSAPSQPPANLILGPGAGFIDKIRDALSGRTT